MCLFDMNRVISLILVLTLINMAMCRGGFLKSVKPFRSKDKQDPASCEVNLYRRRACGQADVQPADCMARGCCWVPCADCEYYIPWCFEPAGGRPLIPPSF